MMEPISRHKQVLAEPRSGFAGRMTGYDQETCSARFFLTNGKIVGCFSVMPVAAEEVVLINRELDSLTRFQPEVAIKAIERALPGDMTLVQ